MSSHLWFEISLLIIAAVSSVIGAAGSGKECGKNLGIVISLAIVFALVVTGDDLWRCMFMRCRAGFVNALLFKELEFWVLLLKIDILLTVLFLLCFIYHRVRQQ